MYLIIDTVRYNNVQKEIVADRFVKYTSNELPKLDSFTEAVLYRNDDIELRRDLCASYHRWESEPGKLLMTQLPLIEQKTVIDADRFYVSQGTVQDGVVIDPVGEGYVGVDVEAPIKRQYTEDIIGFIKPQLDEDDEWQEGATPAEIIEWEATHHKGIPIEERMDAAEAAIRALMG